MTTRTGNIVDLETLNGETIKDVPELIVALNDIINNLNDMFRNLSVANLNGEVKSVTVRANSSLRISHTLKKTPKHVLFLRIETTESVPYLTQGLFTDTTIELNNNNSSDIKVTVLIVKG